MSNKQESAAIEWMQKAMEDREAVQILAAHVKPPFSLVCFHCQQYVEKLIKALLTLNDIEAPYTHNLRRLIQLASPLLPRLTMLADLADLLSAHGVQSRYPDSTYHVDRAEMQKMIKITWEFADILLPALPKVSE